MNKEHDITLALFLGEEPTPEDLRKQDLWAKASEEAISVAKNKTPMEILRKTEETYRKYLREAGLKYDEERGL